ncbi:hypothetical protein [Mucisphaera sp.]|uniref:hypothetical protein n=1 Tax=Mucisphaera sp. TaxID=2913024 RepID=UPI003D0BFF8C
MLRFLMLACVLVVAGCESMEDVTFDEMLNFAHGQDVEQFTFDTGGAANLEGLGAWRVDLTRGGAFKLRHTMNGETTDYDFGSLTDDQASNLWAVVDRLPFNKLSKGAGTATGGEPTYFFGWTVDGKAQTAEIPTVEALQNQGVAAMVNVLEPLIAAETGLQVQLD